MNIFPYLRTKRIAVALRELTLGEGMAVCQIPGARNEAATTALLRFVADKAETPRPGYITDPRMWTVGERIRVVAHYMMQMADDGPNFAVGSGHLVDYVMLDSEEAPDPVPVGELDGQAYRYWPMVGALAEVLELECSKRADWFIAAAATLVLPDGVQPPAWADMADTAILTWVRERVDAFKARPESETELLFAMAAHGAEQTTQFVRTTYTDDGIVCLPVEEAGLYPGRFRPISCVSQVTRNLLL